MRIGGNRQRGFSPVNGMDGASPPPRRASRRASISRMKKISASSLQNLSSDAISQNQQSQPRVTGAATTSKGVVPAPQGSSPSKHEAPQGQPVRGRAGPNGGQNGAETLGTTRVQFSFQGGPLGLVFKVGLPCLACPPTAELWLLILCRNTGCSSVPMST